MYLKRPSGENFSLIVSCAAIGASARFQPVHIDNLRRNNRAHSSIYLAELVAARLFIIWLTDTVEGNRTGSAMKNLHYFCISPHLLVLPASLRRLRGSAEGRGAIPPGGPPRQRLCPMSGAL